MANDPPFFLDPKYTAAEIQAYQRRKAEEGDKPPRVNGNGEIPALSLSLDMTSGKNPEPVGNLNNATIILEHDDHLQIVVWFDEFLQKMMTKSANNQPREWTDGDDINLTLYMQRARGIKTIQVKIVAQAAQGVALRNTRNCVKDYLEPLEWDGLSRIAQFFPQYFGAPDNEYTRAASRNFFIGLIARIYQPGCQLKNMVILEGVQDASKSSALNALVGDAWFAEQHESAMNKAFFETLRGKWLVEIPEMDAFGRAEITRVKAVVSCKTDRFRVPWDRHASDHPRQCVFVGTSNKGEGGVFNDDTGAVRFWPITCKDSIDRHAIAAARDQLFAEALLEFEAGATWWHVPKDQAEQEQKSRFVQDVWHDDVVDYANDQLSGKVTIPQILENLGIKKGDRNRLHEMRVASILKFAGWKRKQSNDGKWAYVKDENRPKTNP